LQYLGKFIAGIEGIQFKTIQNKIESKRSMENKLNKKRKYHRKSFIIRVIAEVQKVNPKDM